MYFQTHMIYDFTSWSSKSHMDIHKSPLGVLLNEAYRWGHALRLKYRSSQFKQQVFSQYLPTGPVPWCKLKELCHGSSAQPVYSGLEPRSRVFMSPFPLLSYCQNLPIPCYSAAVHPSSKNIRNTTGCHQKVPFHAPKHSPIHKRAHFRASARSLYEKNITIKTQTQNNIKLKTSAF